MITLRKTVISLLSRNHFGIDYTSNLLAPMLSNILVNQTRSKKEKLSANSKDFFLKALEKVNFKEYLMIRVKHPIVSIFILI